MELQTQTPNTGLSLFDSNHYATIIDVANMMAATNLTPETLRGTRSGQKFTPFPLDEIKANCFMVAEQAMRWGLSPTGCAQHASIVRGKLMWEGQLVAAVLENSTGVRLKYTYSGSGLDRKVIVSGRFADETEDRTVEGTVKGWKTSQWMEDNYDQRLAYRGDREWCRRHSPASMLGIRTNDEELPQQAERNMTLLRENFEDPTKFQAIEEKPELKEEPTKEDEAKAFEVTIAKYELKEGTSKGKPWKLHVLTFTNGDKEVEANTFSNTIGGLAEFNVGGQAMVTLEKTPKGLGVLTLEILTEETK